jgi:hypothetical protein
VVPGRLDERVRDSILAETRENPLALVELPRGLTAAEHAGGFGVPDTLARRALATELHGQLSVRWTRRSGDTQAGAKET